MGRGEGLRGETYRHHEMNTRGREGNSIEAIKEATDAVTETIKNVREEA
jgi:hypothetical protein